LQAKQSFEPVHDRLQIPAFAGMTEYGGRLEIPAFARMTGYGGRLEIAASLRSSQ
jgi:hypothetical protein